MAEGLNTAGVQLGAVGIAAGIDYIQLHSATPSAGGSNECSSARKAVTCTAAGGVVTVPQTAFTGVAASGAVKFVGYWSALTGGIFLGYNTLSGDQTANASGEYTVSASTITGTSS